MVDLPESRPEAPAVNVNITALVTLYAILMGLWYIYKREFRGF